MLNLAVCTANLHVGSGSLWCEGTSMNIHKSAEYSEHVTSFSLMNSWHCRVSLSECTCRTYTSCSRNVTEPQAKEYTHVQHRNCGSGLAKACCTQAGPAHIAGHVEKSWTDESLLFWHALPVAPIEEMRVQWKDRQQRQTALRDCHAVTSITLDAE